MPSGGVIVKGTHTGFDTKTFVDSHWKAKISILQEGVELILWCTNCGMHVLVTRLEKHKHPAICDRVTYMRMRSRDEELEQILG